MLKKTVNVSGLRFQLTAVVGTYEGEGKRVNRRCPKTPSRPCDAMVNLPREQTCPTIMKVHLAWQS
jgi:hypothetical protein